MSKPKTTEWFNGCTHTPAPENVGLYQTTFGNPNYPVPAQRPIYYRWWNGKTWGACRRDPHEAYAARNNPGLPGFPNLFRGILKAGA